MAMRSDTSPRLLGVDVACVIGHFRGEDDAGVFAQRPDEGE
jgi:hypothetical protein